MSQTSTDGSMGGIVDFTIPLFITPYRHVKPLDRQTYHQHHRRAHSANGEQWWGVSDY